MIFGRSANDWPACGLSAKVAGNNPMMVSMMSPMLFCPSFVPWAKLTPVQVRIKIPRIHQTGGVSVGRLVQVLVMNRLAGEKVQPTRQRKAEDRREGQGVQNRPELMPVNAVGHAS